MQRLQPETVTLDDILITEELSQRPPRPANLLSENQAMRSLARQMVNATEFMLQSLVEMAVELCQAGTAGVSLPETLNGEEIFRWTVLAGTLARYVGVTTPRNFSPCGICLDCLRHGGAEPGAPVLFSYPERYFTYFQDVKTPIVEGLVLPLIADDYVFGTIWIMSHDENRHFDSEDVRVMTSLADFTAAALLLNQRQSRELLAINAALEAEIVERKQAEAQLRALIGNLPGGATFVVDHDLRYLLAEGEALSAAGFKREDLVGHTIFEVLPSELVANYEVLYRKTLAGESFEYEHNAHARSYISRGTPLRSPNGEVYAALAVSYDITERKRREANLAFLADIGEALSELSSADEIIQTVGGQLGAFLSIALCYVVEINEARDEAVIDHAWKAEGMPGVPRSMPISGFEREEFRLAVRAGETIAVRDAQDGPHSVADSYAALRIHGYVKVALHSDGESSALLVVCDDVPRDWRLDEIELICEVAQRVSPRLQRAHAEAVLREREEKYRTLFNSIDEGYALCEVIYDAGGKAVDLRYLEVNPAFARLSGLENAAGKTARELNPLIESLWIETAAKVAEMGEAIRFEDYAEGLGRWLDIYFSRVGREGDRQVAVVFNDISDRKRAEEQLRRTAEFDAFRLTLSDALRWSRSEPPMEAEVALIQETAERTWAAVERTRAEAALRKSEERFRLFVTASSDIVYEMSADWSEMRSLVGKEFIANTENPSRSWLQEYIPEEDQPLVWAAIQEAIRTKSKFELEHRVIQQDSTVGWTFSRAIPVLNPQGEIVEWFGAASDVTEQRQAEEALRESEQRLSVIFAQAAVGLSEISLSGHFQQVNDALCRLLGRSRSELLAASVFDVTHPDDVPASLEALAQLIETGEPVSLDKRYLRPDGTILWENSILTRLDDEQGHPRHVLVVTLDLSDRKQAEANQIQLIREQAVREEERQRAETLAELNRAKTIFLGNVSHEFRTPLTLLLAPLQDALSDRTHPLPPPHRERLELAHRNSLRLLKLVNTLLDFSRIEAGRMEAVYEPTDLAMFTTELASVFRSAIERAGLRLIVDCPPLPEPVYIDREMWEKIVLNLLSNAFKFTFEGEIKVRLYPTDGNQAMLQIQDTGTGISPEHLPHLFERFYQVRGTKGRTHEGSGIGLALVHELVRLHGGTIEVSSTVGQGTCFAIALPFGTGHLPCDLLGDRNQPTRILASTATGAAPYVEEVERWLPEEGNGEWGMGNGEWGMGNGEWGMGNGEWGMGNGEELSSPTPHSPLPTPSKALILLVDDNADMREYLTRILSEHVKVIAVADGAAALAAIQAQVPDLVLSDVMMPELDGFQLLQALRASPRTREVPILLLSARAGEEALVEGLEAGADDYLIKPFSAQELVSRVNAHLQMAQLRGEALHEARTTIRRRDELISTVSHELNTPLVSILGWTRLLRANPPSPSMLAKALDTIERNATLQAKLIQDLLDISRITAGKLRLNPQPVELKSVIETAIATVAQTAQAKGIDVVWQETTAHPDTESLVVMGDSDRLGQVICNLLTNAIKFTPESGSVTIELSAIDDDNSPNAAYAQIRVVDTGIGIAADFLPHVFERFRQAEGSNSVKGLGLGLAIARHLVELHNGTIHAQSAGVGQGATFIVRLPLLKTSNQ